MAENGLIWFVVACFVLGGIFLLWNCQKPRKESTIYQPNSEMLALFDAELLEAAEEGSSDIVEALLAIGASANARNNNTFTALMIAAMGGHTEVVETLIAHGADVNAKNIAGMTALMTATLSSNSATIRVLLDNGADVNARDHRGWAALEWATKYSDQTDIAQLLNKSGARHANDVYTVRRSANISQNSNSIDISGFARIFDERGDSPMPDGSYVLAIDIESGKLLEHTKTGDAGKWRIEEIPASSNIMIVVYFPRAINGRYYIEALRLPVKMLIARNMGFLLGPIPTYAYAITPRTAEVIFRDSELENWKLLQSMRWVNQLISPKNYKAVVEDFIRKAGTAIQKQ